VDTLESARLLTVDEAAARLGLHPQSVRRLIRAGEIAAVTLGRATSQVALKGVSTAAVSRPLSVEAESGFYADENAPSLFHHLLLVSR
jgi:excisionase family DNA binding protein